MKQVLQNLRTGELAVAETPAPEVRPGSVVVRTSASLISPGTERMVIEMARRSWLGRAWARPDLVGQVVRRLRTDGPVATARSVRARLDVPVPLGYSCAGTVMEVGEGVAGFHVGQRVACAGQGAASHAEFVVVPKHLVAAVPDGLTLEAAAFVTLGAIALHGVRTTAVQVGDAVVVMGLGLIGQLAALILRAGGCRTFALDPNGHRVGLAAELGAAAYQDPQAVAHAVRAITEGRGADAVLVAAGGRGADVMTQAAELCRDRAVVTVVGDVRLALPRRAFYEKELQLRMSRSYGPGRYDRQYEERGVDYPAGYVRWTEGRNLAEFLRLAAAHALPLSRLVTHRIPIAEATRAYELVEQSPGEPALGVILTYDTTAEPRLVMPVAAGARRRAARSASERLAVGFIGAGTFAQSVLLPRLSGRRDIRLAGVATRSGAAAQAVAERYGFELAASSADVLLEQGGLDAVFIATRHDSHAALAAAALRRGMYVFVEKPLALDLEGVTAVVEADAGRDMTMVAFNRRFAEPAAVLRRTFAGRSSPLVITYRVNAGPLPLDSWIRDPEVGGGRLVGEVCHFIDLGAYITGAAVVEVFASSVGSAGGDDSVVVMLRYGDGSLATIAYACDGDRSYPKEHIEVIGAGRVAVVDDFHRVTVVRDGRTSTHRFRGRAKGFDEEVDAFLSAARAGGPVPVPLGESVQSMRVTFAARDSLRLGAAVRL